MNSGNIFKADVIQLGFLMLVAGSATMVSIIALGIVTAFQHLDQLEGFKRDLRTWAGPFVEELCRYHTASALAAKRAAKDDVMCLGKMIKRGEGIVAATVVGNCHEGVCPNADTFDMRMRGKEEASAYGWDPTGLYLNGWLELSWKFCSQTCGRSCQF